MQSGAFRGEKKVAGKGLNHPTEEELPPVKVRCHIQGTNSRDAHVYETVMIDLIMKLRYVFHYLAAILYYGLQLMKDVQEDFM